MKPVLRAELREYWACPVPEHRHRTESAAAKCCSKPVPIPSLVRHRYSIQRDEQITRLRDGGVRWTEIGRIIGTHAQYARTCYFRHCRKIGRKLPDDYYII